MDKKPIHLMNQMLLMEFARLAIKHTSCISGSMFFDATGTRRKARFSLGLYNPYTLRDWVAFYISRVA
jgi:hypothetical protein